MTKPNTDIYQAIFNNLVRDAGKYGLVVTIRQEPLKPLAMGNYITVIEVREAKWKRERDEGK